MPPGLARGVLIGVSVSGLVFGATNRIIFPLSAALMALVAVSVLIARPDIDLGFAALTATLQRRPPEPHAST
jgi:hypothetical protein